MPYKLMFSLSLLVLLASCAAQPPRVSSTTWPETTVATDRQTVSDLLVSELSSTNATIENVSPAMIQIRGQDENADLQKALFSCGACAPPYIRFNMIMSEVPGGTKVVAQYWRVIPQYNGSEERMEITDSKSFNQIQEMLWRLRDRYPTSP